MKPMIPAAIVTRMQRLPPAVAAMALSLLFSLLVIVQQPVLNDDAYSYMRAAALFQHEGASAAFAEYGWYSYSILIALCDYVVPGGLIAAAHLLNAVLQCVLVLAFMRSSAALSGERQQWLAALTILAFPLFNEMRYFVIRDFGFWAFAMVSLWQLLRYREHGNWQNAVVCAAALAAATAFRLEALLLTALAPLGLLGNNGGKRIALLYALLGAIALVLALLCVLLQLDLLALMQYAYRYYLPRLVDLRDLLDTAATQLMQQLFSADNYPGSDNAGVGLVILLFAYAYALFANLVNALSVPVSALLLYAVWRGWLRSTAPWRGPIGVYAGCALLSLLGFISIMHFVTQRYAAFLCLLLLLQVPALLDRWQHHAMDSAHPRRHAWAAVLLCLYFFTDSLVSFGHSRAYLPQAAAWLQQLPAGSGLQTNSAYLAHASGRVDRYDLVTPLPQATLAQLQAGTPLALVLKAGEEKLRAQLEHDPRLTLLQRFGNTHGDEVRIFQVR